jgi:putative Holliday junction resolvase
MRVLALDLGTRRIGVAVSDAGGVLAHPRTTLARARRRDADHATIARMVAEEEAERVLVGLPLSLDGSIGPAARAILDEVDELAAALPVPVDTYDERFTTVTAHDQLRAAGVAGRARAAIVDQQAAVVLLQAWLDGRSEELSE